MYFRYNISNLVYIILRIGEKTMAVGNDKTRILVNIPIELKKQLEDKAKQENRSLSNYIVTVLIKELEKDQ